MRKYLCTALALTFGALGLLAQLPTDNPYLQQGGTDQHWTQQLSWEKVVDVTKVDQLIRTNYSVDSTILSKTLKDLSESGGGVLYFPAGFYYFTSNLTLPSGVILRGVAPEFADQVIDEEAYIGTRLIFPKFAPGAPVSVSSDFENEMEVTGLTKKIQLANAEVKDVALVHLDLNRAIIDFSNKPFDQPMDRAFYKKGHRNLLLLGLRVNNASMTDPELPTTYQKEHNQGWQRWPWDQVANINLTARKNVAIVDCWINNAPTDNYRQNNYMLDDGMTFDGYEAEFKVTDHPGIAINYPLANGLKADKVNRTIEVKNNRIALTKGNQAIMGWVSQGIGRGNAFEEIEEKQNVILKGRTIEAYDYNLLYRDESLSQAKSHTNQYGYKLDYRFVEPAKTDPAKKYPLVLFLHDYTSKGTDNKSQLRHFIWQLAQEEIRKEFPCYIVAPQLTHEENIWRARYNFSYSFPLQVSEEIVDSICANHPVDRDRIYLIGVGVGGDSVWDLAIFNPDKFAALVSIGGYYHFGEHSAKQIAHLPIWMIWGDSDEWLPNERKGLVFTELRLAGANQIRKLNLPQTGKKCWNSLLKEVPEFMPWLFSQERDPTYSIK